MQRFAFGIGPREALPPDRDIAGFLLRGDRSAVTAGMDGLPDSRAALLQVRTAEKQRDLKTAKGGMPPKPGRIARGLYEAELLARMNRIAETQSPFAERLVMHWANHFAISGRTALLTAVAGAYEREAIRPHVFGRFADMLLAVVKHPAMLHFLDNVRSTGPNSPAGIKRGLGLNENLAREILELHTLGVDGGYDQNDVRELAKAITGWSIRPPEDGGDGEDGRFMFLARAHEPGDRTILGRIYENTGSTQMGEAILVHLTRRPESARHVCRRLATGFISDAPSPALVDAMAAAFLDTDGDLPSVYAAMLTHPEAMQEAAPKFRTPQDFVAAMIRLLGPGDKPGLWQAGLETMGQRIWMPPSPKGWDTAEASWASGSGLKARAEFALAIAARVAGGSDPLARAEAAFGARLSDETATAISRAADARQGLALLLMSPEFQRR